MRKHMLICVCLLVVPALSFSNLPRQHSKKLVAKLRNDINRVRTSPCQHNIPLVGHAYRSPTALHAGVSAAVTAWTPKAIFYMSLLAIQFGVQPQLTKSFTVKTINRSSVVLAQEVVKMFASGALLHASVGMKTSLADWSLQEFLIHAGSPAILYLVQNYFTLVAYLSLAPVTFNVLNQTKTLWAALCCYLLMGRRQSSMQMVALVVLLLASVILQKILPLPWATASGNDAKEKDEEQQSEGEVTTTETKESPILANGVIPILIASAISGLTGALCQKSLQQSARNSFLLTTEISVFSIVFLLMSIFVTNSTKKDEKSAGFWSDWTWKTWIPVTTNALGGVLVGLVLQHAGSVRKGFSLIFGLLLSGLFQASVSGISQEQIVGGILACVSLWLHSAFPVR